MRRRARIRPTTYRYAPLRLRATVSGMRASVRSPLLAAAACFLGFGVVLVCAYAIAPIGRLDAIALHGLTALDNPVSDLPAHVAVHSADPLPLLVVLAALFAWGWRLGRRREAIAAAGLVAGANLVGLGLKVALSHPRFHPLLGGDQVGTEAFPSGHATSAMSVALAAVLVAPARARVVVASVAAAYVIAVATSLLVISWHYPSDVLGGLLLSSGFFFLAVAAVREGAAGRAGAVAQRAGAAALSPGLGGAGGCRAGRGGLIALSRAEELARLRARAYDGDGDRARDHGDLGRPGRERHADRRPLPDRPVAGLAVCGGSVLRGLELSLPDAAICSVTAMTATSSRTESTTSPTCGRWPRLAASGCLRIGSVGGAASRPATRGRSSVLTTSSRSAPGSRRSATSGRTRVPGFDPDWRRRVVDAWRDQIDRAIVDGGVYWQTRGPRLETPAEIRFMEPHADLVGMTIASECVAASDLGLAYAAICVVDNLANGVGESELTMDDVLAERARNREATADGLRRLLPDWHEPGRGRGPARRAGRSASGSRTGASSIWAPGSKDRTATR